jgi:hypothetical protein
MSLHVLPQFNIGSYCFCDCNVIYSDVHLFFCFFLPPESEQRVKDPPFNFAP